MGIVNLEKNAKYNFKTYSKIPSTDTIAIKQCQLWETARSSGNLVISSYDSGTGIVTVAIQNSSALYINNSSTTIVIFW